MQTPLYNYGSFYDRLGSFPGPMVAVGVKYGPILDFSRSSFESLEATCGGRGKWWAV